MTTAQNQSMERARQQSLALLNQHLAAAVILQDRMRRSPRHLPGATFIMIDEMCDQVASLMETCTTLIAARLEDLGGTAIWPVLLDTTVPDQSAQRIRIENPLVLRFGEADPLDAFGQSVLDAVTVAEAYGDTTTADVMERIWRDVDRQLWKIEIRPAVERPIVGL
jgi:starvation-inducible DNA-binding protein